MQPLTDKSLREYMEAAHNQAKLPEGYAPDSGMVMRVLADTGYDVNLRDWVLAPLVALYGFEHGAYCAVASAWLTGFQMGREYESRKLETDELERLAAKK